MKTDQSMLEETPVQLTKWEKKLIEKFRESLDKTRPDGHSVTRDFDFPSPLDSDDTMSISVTVRICSLAPRSSSVEVSVGRARAGLTD